MRKITKRGFTTKGFIKGAILSLLLSSGVSSGTNLYADTLPNAQTKVQENKDTISKSCALYAKFLTKINISTLDLIHKYENKELTALEGYYVSELLNKEINSVEANKLCNLNNTVDKSIIESGDFLKESLKKINDNLLFKVIKEK